MYYFEGSVYIEDDDQCQTCVNFAKGVACPLLQALGMGMVVLQDSMIVTNCGFYVEFKRKLKVIKEDTSPENKPPENNIRQLKKK